MASLPPLSLKHSPCYADTHGGQNYSRLQRGLQVTAGLTWLRRLCRPTLDKRDDLVCDLFPLVFLKEVSSVAYGYLRLATGGRDKRPEESVPAAGYGVGVREHDQRGFLPVTEHLPGTAILFHAGHVREDGHE